MELRGELDWSDGIGRRVGAEVEEVGEVLHVEGIGPEWPREDEFLAPCPPVKNVQEQTVVLCAWRRGGRKGEALPVI